MRRLLVGTVVSVVFVVVPFLLGGEWFPPWLWPGLGVAALANWAGMNDPDYLKYWLLFFGVNIAFWAAIFYGLATVYVRRRGRRRDPT